MRPSSLLFVAAAVGVATTVELTSYDSTQNVPLMVADGLTGAVLLASAGVLRDRPRRSRIGVLFAVAGLTWFGGTMWAPLRFVHRGALAHLHLSYPTGRIAGRIVGVTVATVYVISFVEPLATDDGVTLAIALAVAMVALVVFGRSSGTGRRAGVPALVAALALSGALALGVANRVADWRADTQVLWTYNAVISTAAIVLVVDLTRGRWARSVVANLVVDLGGHTGTATLQGELARALGDSTLVVGYWVASERRYVDESGRVIDGEWQAAGRVATPIDDDEGERIAVLIHDAAVLADRSLVASVAAVARLAVVNARLHAASQDRVADLLASRRRIVEAADEQRRRFGVELRDEVFTRLDRVDVIVEHVRRAIDRTAGVRLEDAAAELDGAREELDALSRGIHPLVLTEGGLAAAVGVLAGRAAIPVETAVTADRVPPPIEAALYFVCAEALTNVAKHARATRARIEVATADGVITVVVTDDGRGGADFACGSGLRGLADRVEAFGGRLEIVSGEAGTVVLAAIPLRGANEGEP